ncbi:MAG: Tol-Pal system beta propeller repeat protein TolB [Geobacteraceae bacterium]|nr:Tol-Pal system beta propeller repeat protein TolB [Geobacteraceae bacterium]
MRNICFLILILLALPAGLWAQDSTPEAVEVTAPGNRQLKLAIETPRNLDPSSGSAVGAELSDVISFDLNMSGAIAAETRPQTFSASGNSLAETAFPLWAAAGFDLLVRGEYSVKGDNLTVEFRLFDVLNRKMMTARRYLGTTKDLRRFAHSFADEIMLVVTGEKGPFTTHIAYVSKRSGNKEIVIMDWDGHNLMQLTRNGSINLNPDFSPDGREIIFTSYKRGNPDLFKRALYNTIEVPISHRKGLNITGAWSPDGSKIALALSKDGNSEIYTIARDGSHPVRLTINPAIEVSPVWSPDGSQIAFVSDRLGKPQIFVMNADGGSVRRLTTSGAYNVNPRWSPKGDKIAYARQMSGGFQIFTINPDGTGDTQLTSTGSNENPAWSPDGRLLAFSSKRGGIEAIYVMRADGSGQTRVSQNKGNSSQPAWSSR